MRAASKEDRLEAARGLLTSERVSILLVSSQVICSQLSYMEVSQLSWNHSLESLRTKGGPLVQRASVVRLEALWLRRALGGLLWISTMNVLMHMK